MNSPTLFAPLRVDKNANLAGGLGVLDDDVGHDLWRFTHAMHFACHAVTSTRRV
jgi:hypothetical protein